MSSTTAKGEPSIDKTRNKLALEKSPYLLQHASNPVNWFPWGNEAIEKARREDKLIFLSVGYSTCHWCHVMERESFENPEIAQVMNRYFVNVKVDREERPDIDKIYMTFIQASIYSGHRGLPRRNSLLTHFFPFRLFLAEAVGPWAFFLLQIWALLLEGLIFPLSINTDSQALRLYWLALRTKWESNFLLDIEQFFNFWILDYSGSRTEAKFWTLVKKFWKYWNVLWLLMVCLKYVFSEMSD